MRTPDSLARLVVRSSLLEMSTVPWLPFSPDLKEASLVYTAAGVRNHGVHSR